MRWKNYARILLCGFALSCNALPALANFTITQGSGLSIFSIDSGTTPAGTGNCAAATTECTASIPIDKSGTPLFVTGNAGLVTGTGGTFPATQSGNWTSRVAGNAGGVLDAVVGAAVPANLLAVGVNNGGNLTGLYGDSTNGLWVNIKSGAGSGGTAIADKAAWTVSSTNFTLSGGEFTTGGATACTTGQACTVGMTAARGFFTDVSSMGGTAIASGCTGALNGFSTTIPSTVCGVFGSYVLNATPLGSAVSASSSPVVIASDQAAVAVKAASGAIASGAVASGAFASGSIGSGAIASGAVASGAFASGAFASGSFLNATAGDPCMFQAKTNVPISTASGTLALVTGVSTKKIYVCSLSLISSGAIAVSLSEGSGTTCGTSAQAAVIGVATNGTAANGLSLAANGGLTLGNGGGTVAQTATAANYLCLFQSGTTQMAGNLTYVQQ